MPRKCKSFSGIRIPQPLLEQQNDEASTSDDEKSLGSPYIPQPKIVNLTGTQ